MLMLPVMKELKLKANNLTDFPKIELNNLVWLNLDGNKIVNMDKIRDSNLPKLKKLQLNKNLLKEIPVV